jgi:ribosome-binding factor A
MSRRTERLGSSIQQEIANMILRDLNDPRVLPLTSVTRVKISEDLSIADVFITVMGTPGQQTAALNALKHSAGMMRTRLTKALTLRVAPFIKFHIDEQLRKELDVLSLLEKVKKEDAARHAQHDPESVDSTTNSTTDATTDASTEEPTKTEE